MEAGIYVKGAREHNLKNINVFIPRGKITVITGLSGSGKSSLAFDTIFAEGQRRYVDGLSAYARNFIEQLKKPQVDSILGLSPAIAIDQKSISHNPRSTVGTISEIYDYVRLLMARVGVPECPVHKTPVTAQTQPQIMEDILKLPPKTKYLISAPIYRGKKGEFLAEFQKWIRKGFSRVKIDGEWMDLESATRLSRHREHNIDLLIDRLVNEEKFLPRLKESLNLALSLAGGRVVVEPLGGESIRSYSLHSTCSECGFSFPEIEPRLFSFNNPRGACPECNGLGTNDIEEIQKEVLVGVGESRKATVETQWRSRLKTSAIKKTDFEDGEEDNDFIDQELRPCSACGGTRLRPEALNIKINGNHIADISKLDVDHLSQFFSQLHLDPRRQLIVEKIVQQVVLRLSYLQRVGVGYLSLDRPARTLSGGEAQRIRLASQVGSALVGVLYVLDEPSIGLHPRDHQRLLEILHEIRDLGNTVLLVEHDEETIRSADYLIDLGPRAGKLGGELLAQGTPQEIIKNKKSLTGKYLSGEQTISAPLQRRSGSGNWLVLKGAQGHNLKNVNLKIPLGTFVGVTGVSGSGKSTLIIDTLYRILGREFNGSSLTPEKYDSFQGLEALDRVIEINQRPIGKTPRSVPATYVGIFPLLRDLFAKLPEAQVRGFRPGHFSFNVKGGRCESCQGRGSVRVAMHFMADVEVKCDLCQGQRYSRELLCVKFRDCSIADVLAMTVEEALDFFRNHPQILRRLETLHRVGLDYMTLGQSSTTLSGGEAQRIKLSRELSKRATGKTIYILDEPTTGLHFADVYKLIDLLQELVQQGNTVVVIEHHMDVIKSCDYVVDLGPEGGKLGGNIVASGTPEEVAVVSQSETGKFLKKMLNF
ncbi:MAG: excinuclease ABC subunit UvrA [Bdellovibrionales bacterium]|nr:excinuclease ABC subunit UvrA [Bdellovibrionales bacterium]